MLIIYNLETKADFHQKNRRICKTYALKSHKLRKSHRLDWEEQDSGNNEQNTLLVEINAEHMKSR